jgi:hypothetical protein
LFLHFCRHCQPSFEIHVHGILLFESFFLIFEYPGTASCSGDKKKALSVKNRTFVCTSIILAAASFYPLHRSRPVKAIKGKSVKREE